MSNNSVQIRLQVDSGSATQSLTDVGQSIQQIATDATRANASLSNLGQSAQSVGRSMASLSSAASSVAMIGAGGYVAAQALRSMMAPVIDLTKSMVMAQVQADQMIGSMRAVFGDLSAGQAMQYTQATADRLGVSLTDTARAYASLSASTKGTNLEGEKTRQIFEAIAGASAKMGMSSAQTQQALVAVSQMAGKGVVSMEELRGQLSEALPGAMQAAARAMGVTVAELGKLAESGELLAGDLLPKLADELNKTFGGGGPVDTAGASINRLNNQWDLFKQSLAQTGIADTGVGVIKGMTIALRDATTAMEEARKAGWGGVGQGVAAAAGFIGGDVSREGQRRQLQRDIIASEMLVREYREKQARNGGSLSLMDRHDMEGQEKRIKYLMGEIDKLTSRRGQIVLPDLAGIAKADADAVHAAADEALRSWDSSKLATKAEGNIIKLAKLAKDYQTTYMAALAAGKPSADLDRIVSDYTLRAAEISKDPDAAKRASEATATLKEHYANRLDTIAQALSAEERAIKLSVAERTSTEYEAITATRDAVAQAAQERIATLAEQYGKTSDQSERAKLLGELTKAGQDYAKAFDEAALATAKFSAAQSEGWLKDSNAAQAALDQQIEKAREELMQIGMTADAKDQLAAKQREAAAALADETAAVYESARAWSILNDNPAGEEFYERAAQSARQRAASLREIASLESQQAGARVAAKAAEESARAWEKFADDIERSLTDSLYRSFESGKGFGEAFVDSLRNTLKSAALKLVIQAVVDPVMGTLRGFINPASAAGTAVSTASGIGNLVGAGKNAYQLYSAATGLASTMYKDIATSQFGQQLGLGTANTYAAPVYDAGGKLVSPASGSPGELTTLGESVGKGLATAGAAIIGSAIGNAISGDYRISRDISMANVGSMLGSLFGPAGAGIGGVVGGIVDRAFGMGPKSVTGQGVEGTFAGAGFAGRTFADWHQNGGWFRSDKSGTEYGSIAQSAQEQLGLAFTAIKLKVADLAMSLKINTASIAAYSKTIRQSIDGEAWNALLTSMTNDMAALALAGSDFGRDGETAIETLTRLSTDLQSVNGWLTRMDADLIDVSLSGGNAASSLIDLMGGMDDFTRKQAAYFETYYSQSEQLSALRDGLTAQFDALGLSMPETTEAFRELVKGLDLNTSAGQSAYAALVDLAPTFAEITTAIDEMAKETAKSLIAAYTVSDDLAPQLDAARLASEAIAAAAASSATSVEDLSRSFLDLSTGLVTTETDVTAATDGLDSAAATIAESVDAMRLSISNSRTDFDGLATALSSVNLQTYVATITGILDLIGERLTEVHKSIASERIAVREAAISIIDPATLSKTQIRAGIDAVTAALPSQTALLAAQAAITQRDADQALYDRARSTIADFYGIASLHGVAVNAAAGAVDMTNSAYQIGADGRMAGYNQISYGASQGLARNADGTYALNQNGRYYYVGGQDGASDFRQSVNMPGGLVDQLDALAPQIAAIATRYTATTTDSLVANLRTATLAYSSALQDFAASAEIGVKKLSRLRAETVKYYEEQSRLAGLMAQSAAGLRGAAEQYRFSQLDEQGKYESLKTQYSAAYTMAQVTSGETLAGYADKLTSLFPAMMEAAAAVLGSDALESLGYTTLSQVEAIASRLESLAPKDYQSESLGLLGDIDAALILIDENALSASRAIALAVKDGADLTASGLRAVVAALTGEPVPAFAAGGFHVGGLRLVGEQGPELEATGPARIYSAGDTARMLRASAGNDGAAMAAELAAIRRELEALRAESRATALNTGKSARIAERLEVDGMVVRTDADTPLLTEVAA